MRSPQERVDRDRQAELFDKETGCLLPLSNSGASAQWSRRAISLAVVGREKLSESSALILRSSETNREFRGHSHLAYPVVDQFEPPNLTRKLPTASAVAEIDCPKKPDLATSAN
jgi:hypothetical protein